jgi:glutamate carboxypeptidase
LPKPDRTERAPRRHTSRAARALGALALVATCTATCAAPLFAGSLNPTERRITAAVDRGVPASLALLRRAVEINSGTHNLAGVREVGRLFEPEFARLGFTVRWADGAAWGRAGHLVAERRGRAGAPRVLLIGHLDTVFELSSPFQTWEALGDTAAHAPGSTDMKGGDVVMLLALSALRQAGRLDALEVTVVLTGDEELAGQPYSLSRADLFTAARAADLAIGFEDGPGDPRMAVVARRGSSSWRLDVWAQPAHSSQIFRDGVGEGAIFTAARLLRAFRDSLAGEELLTFNPGAIVGGTDVTWLDGESRGTAFGKSNVIAESTVVVGDLRAISVAQRDRAKDVMRAIVALTGPESRATIAFDDGYPPLAPAPGNLWLLGRFDEASRDLGAGPVTAGDPRNAGAADVSFTQGLTPMAIDGVGLMGTGGHTVRETADLRTLPLNAKRVAVMLSRLAQAPRPFGKAR